MKNATIHVLALLTFSSMICCGCSPSDPVITDPAAATVETYTTEMALTPLEYNNFINKELDIIINKMSAQLSLIKSLKDGSCSYETAEGSAGDAYLVIKECRDKIQTMRPPNGYEGKYEQVLNGIQESLSDISRYQDDLKDKSIASDDYEAHQDDIQKNIAVLTAQFGTYWK